MVRSETTTQFLLQTDTIMQSYRRGSLMRIKLPIIIKNLGTQEKFSSPQPTLLLLEQLTLPNLWQLPQPRLVWKLKSLESLRTATGLTFGTTTPKDGVHVTGVEGQLKIGCSLPPTLMILSGMIQLGRPLMQQLSSTS